MNQIIIKSPRELQEAVDLYFHSSGNPELRQLIVFAIAKYKWYNFYLNLHIKAGSEMDLENEIIFFKLTEEHPDFDTEIEKFVQKDIDKYNIEEDDL